MGKENGTAVQRSTPCISITLEVSSTWKGIVKMKGPCTERHCTKNGFTLFDWLMHVRKSYLFGWGGNLADAVVTQRFLDFWASH